jgi:hypothetical protein
MNGALDSVRVATVTAGASTATMLDIADAGKLTVGAYVCLCGHTTQGDGTPPNLHFFEYIVVAGISGTTITFDRPVRQTYRSTWQDDGAAHLMVTEGLNGGGVFGWDQTIGHYGYTVTQSVGGHTRSRDIRLHDMALDVFTPTNSSVVLLDNCTIPSGSVEVDKLIEVFRVHASTVRRLYHQSSAPGLLYIDSSTLTVALDGTPRHTIVSYGTLAQLALGCFYGCTKSVVAANSTISSWQYGSASFDLGGDAQSGVQNAYTMSGGVITMPRTARPTTVYPEWAVPGCVAFFGGKYPYGASFTVDDVTADASNVYVHTSLAGGFPTVPLDGSSRLQIRGHPCPKLTVTNCTGCEDSLDLSNAPAGRPVGSWSRRAYTAAHTSAIQTFPLVMGRVSEIRVNVTTAFTGTGGTLQARVFDVPLLNSSGVEVRYEPVIDLSVAGERVVTLSGVAGSGGTDSGLALPAGAWFVGSAFAGFNAFRNVSAQAGVGPAVTVTIVADQEAVATDDPDYAALVAMAVALVPEVPPPVTGDLRPMIIYIGYGA